MFVARLQVRWARCSQLLVNLLLDITGLRADERMDNHHGWHRSHHRHPGDRRKHRHRESRHGHRSSCQQCSRAAAETAQPLRPLPAIRDLLESALESYEAGSVSADKIELARPTLQQCQQALSNLRDISMKDCPKETGTSAKRIRAGTRAAIRLWRCRWSGRGCQCSGRQV